MRNSIDKEKRFRETFEQAALGIAHVGLDGAFELVNDKFCELVGYSADEFSRIRFQDITHKDDLETDLSLFRKLLAGEMESYSLEKRYITKAGKIIWINLFVSLVRDELRKPNYFVGVIEHISERKAEELNQRRELDRARVEFDRFFNMSIDYFVIASTDGYFKVVNDTMVKNLGYTREELTSQPYINFVHPEDRGATSGITTELQNGIPTLRFENRYLDKGGKIHWLSWKALPMPEEGVIYAAARDVTELKLQAQLIAEQQAKIIEASRLNSLGQMAAGIAHEINNPLSVLYLNTLHLREIAQLNGCKSEEAFSTLDTMEQMTWRMTNIIKGLKTFARDGTDDPFEAVNLNDIVHSSLSLIDVLCKDSSVDLEVEAIPDSLYVSGRPVQLSQVIVNLLSNSIDAVSELHEKWIKVKLEVSDASVLLRFIDSGKGIEKKVEEKLFEPFFTTKSVGHGTGLGLSISHGIAKAHEGSLYYDSTSANTCFVLKLPILHEG